MDSAGAHLDSIRSPGRGTGRTPPGTVEVDPRVPSAPAAAAARAPLPVVRTAGLTKQFGRFNALTDLTVEMTQGEVFGYLGPNGAGKTTTIRLLLGLLRPTRGRVELFGVDAWSRAAQVHQRVGYLPGDPATYDRLTGRELVTYLGHLRGRQDPTGVRALADRFDVDLTRPLRSLSKGNRQKVALILAFMGEPELILLDEPTSGLDPLVQQEFHALVRERAAEGSSVLLSSHVLAEVQRMADRVGILRRGRLVAVESLADLRAKAVHHVSARFTHAVPREAFADLPGLRDLTVQGAAMRCGAPEASLDRIVKAIARFEVVDLTCQEADLEETFLAFYGQEDVDAAHHHPQDPA